MPLSTLLWSATSCHRHPEEVTPFGNARLATATSEYVSPATASAEHQHIYPIAPSDPTIVAFCSHVRSPHERLPLRVSCVSLQSPQVARRLLALKWLRQEPRAQARSLHDQSSRPTYRPISTMLVCGFPRWRSFAEADTVLRSALPRQAMFYL